MTKEKITKRYKAKILKEYCIFQMEVQGLLANSVYQNLIHIEPFVKEHKRIANPSLIKRIKPEDVHKYVIQNASGFSRKYLKNFLYSLRSFFKFLVFKGYTQYNLMSAIPKVPTWQLSNIPRGIPWNDVEKLLKMPNRKTRKGKRNYALLLLAATYGVRYYQARKLRLKDILWKNKVIHFRSCKGGRPLSFPLYIDVAEALLDYIKNGRPDYFIEPEDARRWIGWLKEHRSNSVYWKLASFMLLTGARVGEACGMKWSAVDLKNGMARIIRRVRWDHFTREPFLEEVTKTSQSARLLILPKRLQDILLEMKKTAMNDLVFTDTKGELLRYNAVQSAFNAGFVALNLPWRSTHICRHTYATIALIATKNISAVQASLGHTEIRMTQKYAKTVALLNHEVGEKTFSALFKNQSTVSGK